MDDLSKVTTNETAWELGYVSGLKDAVKHGKWIHTHIGTTSKLTCSSCGHEDILCEKTRYCPNCGAKMDIKE